MGGGGGTGGAAGSGGVGGRGSGGVGGGMVPSSFTNYTLSLDDNVSAPADVVVADISLLPRFTLSGQVLDADGNAVGGARVSGSSDNADVGAFHFQSSFTNVVTDATVPFQVPVYQGTFNVSGSIASEPPGSATVVVNTNAEVTINLPRTVLVSGRVLDAEGTALASQEVCLDPPVPPDVPSFPRCMWLRTTTGPDGRFAFNVLSGDYSLTVRGGFSTPGGGGGGAGGAGGMGGGAGAGGASRERRRGRTRQRRRGRRDGAVVFHELHAEPRRQCLGTRGRRGGGHLVASAVHALRAGAGRERERGGRSPG